MSTMKKRIPMFLLALAMMVAMAVPTFADGFHPAGCGNLYLNITRSNASQSVYQRPLCLYETTYKPDEDHNDQNFTIGTSDQASGFFMYVTKHSTYAVNRSTADARAIIWDIRSGVDDSRLVSRSKSSITLWRTGEKLTAIYPIANYSRVYFGGSGNSSWQVTEDSNFIK